MIRGKEMDNELIVYGLICCVFLGRISLDIISRNCQISKDDAKELINIAKENALLYCNKDLEIEMPLIVSNIHNGYDLDKVCVIDEKMKLDGSDIVKKGKE